MFIRKKELARMKKDINESKEEILRIHKIIGKKRIDCVIAEIETTSGLIIGMNSFGKFVSSKEVLIPFSELIEKLEKEIDSLKTEITLLKKKKRKH